MKRQSIPTAATAHAMLMMTVVLLSSGFARSDALNATPSTDVRIHHAATTLRGGAIDRAEVTEPPGYTGSTFPQGAKWSLQKAPPKKSLRFLPIPQTITAAAWILNLIELTHWTAFPLGFYVAHYIFENASNIDSVLDESSSRVFYITLGLFCQVFGGGISGSIRHLYEGWQIAPFRDPLQASPAGQKVPVEEFNNSWLRSVAWQTVFTFQTLGLGLFTMGVFGVNPWTKALVGGSTAVALLGPKEPRLGMTRMVNGQLRPALPLSLSLGAVFVLNVVANLGANMKLFSAAMEDKIPIFLSRTKIPACLVSIVPTLLVTAGVAIEGWFAETTFNQWHHWMASVSLLAGLASSFLLYERLVEVILQG